MQPKPRECFVSGSMELEMVLDFDVTAGTLRLQIVNRYHLCLVLLVFSHSHTRSLASHFSTEKQYKKKY